MSGLTPAEKRQNAIESGIYDLATMSMSAALVLDIFLKELRGGVQSGVYDTPAELLCHVDEWMAATDFMVHHTHNMAVELREQMECE